jgi:hypothetical protein
MPEYVLAAIPLMDCVARTNEGDDPNVVHLADQLAEAAALWASRIIATSATPMVR